MNIFENLFTNTKPIIIPKGQKTDLFVGAKELQAFNKIGYYGNSQFYLKLYKNLKTAFDNYKVSISRFTIFHLKNIVISPLMSFFPYVDCNQ